jgi:hypothetical protein
MKRFLAWWWPTIGYSVIVVLFAGLTWLKVSAHESAGTAGLVTACFGFLLVREVQRTREERADEQR